METTLKIYNGVLLTPYRIIPNGTIVIIGNKIVEVREGNIDVPNAIEINARGQYVSPGFIDMHVHGGGGHDFMDGSVEAFLKIAETHSRYGTTSMLPTTLTSTKDELLRTLEIYKIADEINNSGAQFLGMHLEGPYFAMSQRGAQDPRYIRDPDPIEYKEIVSQSNNIKRWSAAPELNGALEFAHYLKSKGILVSMAHTNALYDEALAAFENGYTLATHFYSSMSSVVRKDAVRYAGVVEAGYLIDEMDVEIIADGVHLPPALLKLIIKIKGIDRVSLITDAIRAAGTQVSETIIGSKHNGVKVMVEDGVAKLLDRSSFAGSVATTDRLVRTMIEMADISVLDAVRMMTATPANILGIQDHKGTLVPRKDADIVVFNNDIQIQMTIVNGKVVYDNIGKS